MASPKERRTADLLSYLGNPDNRFPTRSYLATKVLGYSDVSAMYKLFTLQEMCEIENEAMELRAKHSASCRSRIYNAMVREAEKGNVQAMKEYLDRTEGKVTDKTELTGKDGADIGIKINHASITDRVRKLNESD